MRGRLVTYLHPETVRSSRPREEITFAGHSVPYFARVREGLATRLHRYPSLPPRCAEWADFGTVHTAQYLGQVVALAAGERPAPAVRLSAECDGLWHFLEGYRFGLGGMQEALDRMKRGEGDRAYGFSLGGHHAFADWGHGYCLLNPQAAAVRYAQTIGFGRVLVVDWDVHHGDGTQAIFAHDPTVRCLSIHSALDLYMAKAGDWRQGMPREGRQVGHCNLPVLHARMGEDARERLREYGKLLRGEEAIPAFREALTELPFAPNLVCVFSGYDGHCDDQGRRTTDWTEDDFAELTRLVCDLAQRCDCPVLSVHGGGYELNVALSCAERHVAELAA